MRLFNQGGASVDTTVTKTNTTTTTTTTTTNTTTTTTTNTTTTTTTTTITTTEHNNNGPEEEAELKDHQQQQQPPQEDPDHEPQLHEVIFGKQSCLAFEQDFNNPTRTKFAETDAEGLVFVVDASGDERFDEARDRFYEVLLLELLGHAINVPVLILANKSEHIQAAPEIELYFHLKVSQLVEMGNAKGAWNVKMFMCSAEWGTGYQEVFAWLGDRL